MRGGGPGLGRAGVDRDQGEVQVGRHLPQVESGQWQADRVGGQEGDGQVQAAESRPGKGKILVF